MSDIFGWLTAAEWIAFLRIVLGLWWLESVRHKDLRDFIDHGMIDFAVSLADHHQISSYGKMVKRVLKANRSWFPYLIVLVEISLGVGLTLGLLTPLMALGSIFLSTNYLLLAGLPTTDKSIYPAYEVEQGQLIMMLAVSIVIFFMGAGCTWGLDALLDIGCR
jgi:thiosulfate dehydrogenase (quinone) large subunit